MTKKIVIRVIIAIGGLFAIKAMILCHLYINAIFLAWNFPLYIYVLIITPINELFGNEVKARLLKSNWGAAENSRYTFCSDGTGFMIGRDDSCPITYTVSGHKVHIDICDEKNTSETWLWCPKSKNFNYEYSKKRPIIGDSMQKILIIAWLIISVVLIFGSFFSILKICGSGWLSL